VLRKAIAANKALAELKGAGDLIPKKSLSPEAGRLRHFRSTSRHRFPRTSIGKVSCAGTAMRTGDALLPRFRTLGKQKGMLGSLPVSLENGVKESKIPTRDVT
jgi:hypothetical protein